MIIDTKETHNNVIYRAHFVSLNEFAYYLENKGINEEIFQKPLVSEKTYNSDYCNCSYKQALELCKSGDSININNFLDLSAKLGNSMPKLSQKRNVVSKTYGFRSNVNKYLTGNPNNMLHLARNEQNKFVHVFFNVSSSFSNNSSQIISRGIIAINMIKFLEKIGFRVKLDFFSLCKQASEIFWLSVNIKNENQNLDVSSCYFPMCNTAFGRRLVFRMIECTDVREREWQVYYGQVPTLEETKSILGDTQNGIIISDPEDMNIGGQNILLDAQNLFNFINLSQYLSEGSVLELDNCSDSFVLKKKL